MKNNKLSTNRDGGMRIIVQGKYTATESMAFLPKTYRHTHLQIKINPTKELKITYIPT